MCVVPCVREDAGGYGCLTPSSVRFHVVSDERSTRLMLEPTIRTLVSIAAHVGSVLAAGAVVMLMARHTGASLIGTSEE